MQYFKNHIPGNPNETQMETKSYITEIIEPYTCVGVSNRNQIKIEIKPDEELQRWQMLVRRRTTVDFSGDGRLQIAKAVVDGRLLGG